MKPADIAINNVYANTKGDRFRVVTEIRKVGNWIDVHYAGAYRNTKGKFKPNGLAISGIHSFAEWSANEATPAECSAVIAALNLTEIA